MNRIELEEYITKTYNADAEHPWIKYPDYAVFRHSNNKKWFAVILKVSADKLGLSSKETKDILNVKCDPILVGSLLNERGFYPAYHMNKLNWITISLCGEADEEKIKWLLDMSFDLTAAKIKKNKSTKS